MRFNNNHKIQAITLQALTVMSLLASVACVEKRPEIEAQGSNLEDLIAIQKVDGLKCKLTTSKAPLVKTNFSEADQVTTGDSGFKFYDIMDFKSDCPYLEENKEVLEFRGAPSTTYEIVFKVEPNHFVAYKKVKKKDLSHYEMPYSTRVKGYYLVPIGGFSIGSFYNTEFQKNSDNRNTNVKVKLPVHRDKFKKAGYFTVDKENFVKFQVNLKKDVLPKSYFEGEWFFSESTIDKRLDVGGIVGDVKAVASDHSGRYVDASKIKFLVKKNNIFGVSTNLDSRVIKGDINFSAAIKIPGKLVDYRRVPKGKSLGFSEEKVSRIRPEDSRFFEMKLESVETVTEGRNQGLLSMIFASVRNFDTTVKVIKAEYYKDYFSFVLHNSQSGQVVKYSFLKVNKKNNYSSRVAFLDDMKTFGFFTVTESKLLDETTQRRADFDQFTKISRFNPKKDIVFRFSTSTSKKAWVRNIGRESVHLWQQAFQKAGLKNKIILKEDHEVEIGDIRYNILNIIESDFLQQDGTEGYGPSLRNPKTGEIVSGTVNAYVKSIKFYDSVREFIAKQLGYHVNLANRVTSTSLSPKVRELFSVLGHGLVTQNENGKYVPMSVYQWNEKSQKTVSFKPLVQESDFNSHDHIYGGHQVRFQSFDRLYKKTLQVEHNRGEAVVDVHTLANLASPERINRKKMKEFVNAHCPEVVKFIAHHKANKTLPTTKEENVAIGACAKKRLQIHLLGVVTHEIGHTLGLRHNFMGSSDKENFLPEDSYSYKYTPVAEYRSGPYLSSVMDYAPPSNIGFAVVPGAYDIAALRFAYGGSVEVIGRSQSEGVKTVKVEPSMSLKDFARKTNIKLKQYKYCTDWEARFANLDVFCGVHDTGTSATELVSHSADSMFDMISTYVLRYDRQQAPLMISPIYHLMKMKGVYDKWREYVAREVGLNRKYLQGMSIKEYQAVIQRMLANPEKGKVYRDFLQARNVVVNSLLDLAFLPNKYCVVEDQLKQQKLIEFEKVRTEMQIFGVLDEVKRCKNEAVTRHLRSQGLKLVKEVGFFLKGGIYSLNPMDISGRPLDFSGSLMIRLNALNGLFQRRPHSILNQSNGFLPNMLDEPDIRMMVQELLISRILNGVNLKNKKINVKDYAYARLLNVEDIKERLEENPQNYYKNFKAEQEIWVSAYRVFLQGLQVPRDNQETIARTAMFGTGLTQNPELVKSVAGQITRVNNTTFIYSAKQARLAEIFITQLKKIQQTERDAEKFLSITEAELEAAYSKMEGFLKSLFVGQENVTLQDVVRVSQKIEDVAVQINKEKNLAEIVVYNNAVAPYQGEVQRVLQKFVTDLSGGFSQDFKTKVTPQKVVEAIGAVVRGGMENSEDQMLAQMVKVLTPIMARDAKGLVARNHSYLLTNKDIGAYMDVVRQRVQGLIRTAADVSTNKEEVQAQKDILMEMLKSGARL